MGLAICKLMLFNFIKFPHTFFFENLPTAILCDFQKLLLIGYMLYWIDIYYFLSFSIYLLSSSIFWKMFPKFYLLAFLWVLLVFFLIYKILYFKKKFLLYYFFSPIDGISSIRSLLRHWSCFAYMSALKLAVGWEGLDISDNRANTVVLLPLDKHILLMSLLFLVTFSSG